MSKRMNSATSNVTDQAVDDCPPQAHCEVCHTPISMVKGHRPRRYCSDSCKQRAYLERDAQRLRDARLARLQADYPAFSQGTIDLLDGFEATGNHEMVQRIAGAILREGEDRARGLDDVQQRFAEYVHMTNERLSELSGELATLRQEREQAGRAKRHTKADANELEQARADLRRIRQERAREQEEFHQLYELAQDQKLQLRAAQNRIGELERAERVVMLSDLLYEQGQALDFPELWYVSSVDGQRQKIIKGQVYWQRFCERAAAQEVKAAYEIAQQMLANNHHSPAP